MASIAEARQALLGLALPVAQQNEIAALTLLALAGLGPNDGWKSTRAESLGVSRGIMARIGSNFGRHYAPNTRETFRRQVLHQFVQAGLVDYNPDLPGLATNSPRAHYRLTESAVQALQAFGTRKWATAARRFQVNHPPVPTAVGRGNLLTLPTGDVVQLSPGAHNLLEIAVATFFRKHFAPTSAVAYLGDTAKKGAVSNLPLLESVGFKLDEHGKLPDVILYDAERDWLFLIEAVTSHGPMTPKRVQELREAIQHPNLVLVTAFPDVKAFKKYAHALAWDTEVWIAEEPEHMIHFNGDRFLGPR